VGVERHRDDKRKESFRPVSDIQMIGERLGTKRGDWSDRSRYVMKKKAQSMEELYDRRKEDKTSLGIINQWW
jgi:hypothetical protein